MGSFDRKRKPAGLTTSYELHDHLANTTGNPHPQYVLRSELVSSGGDFNLTSHMNDPEAHANYYIKKVNITNSYEYNNTLYVTSGKAVYDFYQLYVNHLKGYDVLAKNSVGTHDSRYAFKDHTHSDILTTDSINEHNTNPQAHPGMWIPLGNIVNIGEDAPTQPAQYVLGYDLYANIRDGYIFNYMLGTSAVTGYVLTSDTTFVSGKSYFILSNETYTLQSVTAGDSIPASTYYEEVYSVVGPGTDNKLKNIFAARIHSHSYSDVGAAPATHYHDERYSLLGHLHDDRYSLIHSHPYLSDTALEIVGIYPNVKLTEREANANYDAMDPSTGSEYLDEDLNDYTTQGNYYFDVAPLHTPSTDATSTYYPSTGLGTLSVKCVRTLASDTEASISLSNNTFYRVEQEFLDTAGNSFTRHGINSYTANISSIDEETYPDAVTDYTTFCTTNGISVDADATVAEAELRIKYPAVDETAIAEYLASWTTVKEHVNITFVSTFAWSNWKSVLNSAYDAGRRVWVSGPQACTCCYAKDDYVLTSDATFVSGKTYYTRAGSSPNYYYVAATVVDGDAITANTYYEWNSANGNNYVDFELSGLPANASATNVSVELLMECITAVGTDYSVGDVIIDPICSNKANNESSFLGHAQLSFMTLGGSKKIRLFWPLVWYAKRKNTSVTVYGSKTVPIASAAECSCWQLRIKMIY